MKKDFTIVRIQPDNYQHHHAFDEIVDSLEQALLDAGDSVQVVVNKFNTQGTNIIIGAHLLTDQDMNLITKNSIIYNFEQITNTSGFMKKSYVDAMAKHKCWDYSETNIKNLIHQRPSASPKLVPVGYHSILTHLSKKDDEDIDVLFYGSINPRRQKIINDLKATGYNIHTAFGVYCDERDDLIRRAKVVLNMHQHPTNILETVRVSYLMANSKAVVSECAANTEVPEYLRGGLKLVDYNQLVSACVELIEDDNARETLGETALDVIKQVQYFDILTDVLETYDDLGEGAMVVNENAVAVDLGCGSRPRNPYNAKYFYGVDVCDTGNPDVKIADLNVEPIPFETSSVDFMTAFDFIEHVPRLIYIDGKKHQPFIELMNEIHRVLKPDGIFRAHTPAYPAPEAFVDPTHVNFISENTVNYFCGGLGDLPKSYGFTGMFRPLNVYWDETYKFHLVWELQAVK